MSAGGGGRFTRAGYVICSACQAENPASNRFCDRCGTRIGVSTRPPVLKPDAAPPVYPSSPGDHAGTSSTLAPPMEVATGTDTTPSAAVPTDDAAPPGVDLASAPTLGAGSAPEAMPEPDARDKDAVPLPSQPGSGAPADRATRFSPAGFVSGAAAERATRVPSPTSVPEDESSGAGAPMPRDAANSTRPLLVLLGITGGLVAVCVALWVLLVFLGAIDFTLSGASLATSVATIVATRAP